MKLNLSASTHSKTTLDPIDTYDENGYTALMKAVKAMNVESVIALLEQGANPGIKDGNYGTSTALTIAKLLLKRAKTNETRQCYQTIVEALEPVSSGKITAKSQRFDFPASGYTRPTSTLTKGFSDIDSLAKKLSRKENDFGALSERQRSVAAELSLQSSVSARLHFDKKVTCSKHGHDWDGCICRNCHETQHDYYNGSERCSKCGLENPFKHYICKRCASNDTVRREWSDGRAFEERCTHCGEIVAFFLP